MNSNEKKVIRVGLVATAILTCVVPALALSAFRPIPLAPKAPEVMTLPTTMIYADKIPSYNAEDLPKAATPAIRAAHAKKGNWVCHNQPLQMGTDGDSVLACSWQS